MLDQAETESVSGGCNPGGNPGDRNDNGIPDQLEEGGLPPITAPGDKRRDEIR
jgi:hypothetical protein